MNHSLVRRPVAVSMCVIAVLVLGVAASVSLPVSLMPDIDVPQITVQVSHPGYSAQEMESCYVSLLRNQLAQVSEMNDLRSESRADAGSVTLTFEPGFDMDLLFIEVNERIDRAMNSLPQGSDRPKVIKAGAADIPAFYLDINLKDGADAPTRFAELCRFAQSVVAKRVEQLPQTAMVDMSGTVGEEIICTPDADKMIALGLSNSDLEKALSANDITLEALSVASGIYRYHIHFDSQLLTKDDVAGIYLKHGDRLLRLCDVCQIEERMREPTGIVRHNGKRAVTMAIIKQNSARMDDLQQSMEQLTGSLREEYPDLELSLTRDQTRLLSATMDNLRFNLIVGALLASLVLFLFMRQWRLALLVMSSIPLSLTLTLLGFSVMGMSLNIISVSGLILGVGMTVDNSIIVIDNVCRRWQGGESLADAVVRGTREVFMPMLSSVLTTCSVFVPLVFLSGTAGALFLDQSVGLATCLFASLAVAAAVVPVWFFAFYKKRDATSVSVGQKGQRTSAALTRLYERTLNFALRHALSCALMAVCTIPLTIWLANVIGKERMPKLPHTDSLVHINWNSGITVEENDRRVTGLMRRMGDLVDSYTSMCGTQDFILSHTPDISQNEAVVYVNATSTRAISELPAKLTAQLRSDYPQATVTTSDADNILSLMFATDEATLEIHLQSIDGRRPSLSESRRVTDTLRAQFPDVDFMPVETERVTLLTVDMEKMTLYGVSYETLLTRMKTLVNKGRVMEINDGAQIVPVVIGVAQEGSRKIDGLLTETVTNEEGTPVPLYLLVERKQGEDYKRLEASVSGGYYNIAINATDRQVRSIMSFVDAFTHNEGSRLTATYSGGYFSSRKLVADLAVVLGVALVLLFLILAAQFESLVSPFIILAEMAVDVFFVVLVLYMLRLSLNVMSMIGLVVVSGIVINDSILKVDTINRLRRGGMSPTRAILTAGHWRLRPIVMTSLTTILALLPSLFQNDVGSAMQRPLSVTVMVGLTFGTMVSLFFIPLLYSLIYGRKQRRAKFLNQR